MKENLQDAIKDFKKACNLIGRNLYNVHIALKHLDVSEIEEEIKASLFYLFMIACYAKDITRDFQQKLGKNLNMEE
jgi:hypothetical protein